MLVSTAARIGDLRFRPSHGWPDFGLVEFCRPHADRELPAVISSGNDGPYQAKSDNSGSECPVTAPLETGQM